MEAVLDSNVLIRAMISRGDIIPLLMREGVILYAPLLLLEEFEAHREEVRLKSKMQKKPFETLSSEILSKICFVNDAEYESFLPQAESLLGEHLKDSDFVALALLKKCKIWTYEDLLFRLGVGISTKQVADALRGTAP